MVMDLDMPSVCAQKLSDGTVDAGLVPAALLADIKGYHIISDYCIGAVGDVKSVLLLSDVPLEEIETIMLDYQSRTSVALVQVLANQYWNISPEFVPATEGFEQKIQGKTAAVVIGDRTFALLGKHKHTYDLAGEWHKFKNLPFVFAVWVANKPLPEDFITDFNKALKFGLEHKVEAAKLGLGRGVSEVEIIDYLENSISYEFDPAKKVGLHKFLKYLKGR
jgi:chorismate dehydratase